MRKPGSISRIKLDDSRFSLDTIDTGVYVHLGSQENEQAVSHFLYLKRQTLGSNCFIHSKTKVSGYCSYYLVSCDNAGLLGAVFFTYFDKTLFSPNKLAVGRNVQDDLNQNEVFTPLFTLERLDILMYTSNYGSVVIIPSVVSDLSLIVPVT